MDSNSIATVMAAALTAIVMIASAKIKSASVSRDRNATSNGESDSRASASRNRWKSRIALSVIFLATLNLAFMTFGPRASAALSAGDAASIAQSLCLFASGVWLLSR